MKNGRGKKKWEGAAIFGVSRVLIIYYEENWSLDVLLPPFLFDIAKIRKISEICKFFGCFFMVLSAKLNIETFFKLCCVLPVQRWVILHVGLFFSGKVVGE